MYQSQGVPEYWIVDFSSRVFERWRPGDERPEILSDRIEWLPSSDHEPFIVDIPLFFENIVDKALAVDLL